MRPERTSLAERHSLPEVHASIGIGQAQFWRRLMAFAGPAYLVSVGYMDPGNWATDLEGGARFGYQLLWVLVMSNAMALLLQTLSARLGIVTRSDLAQACRYAYPRSVGYALWLLCELAIVACDLAEVLGTAIGLNMLFHIPMLAGVLITAADTLLILWFTRYGIRVIEAFVLTLILTIGGCFIFEILLAHPAAGAMLAGLVPHLSGESLYVAVAILGATVMPHNLYLHSALVQTRRIGETEENKKEACFFNFLDSGIALNLAMFVNAAILILAAAVFYTHGIVVTEIQQAHTLLTPLLGSAAASVVFGAALLASGQSSTLTGTMAGQIVMEGFLRLRMQPWLRRLVTRFLAITPAALTIVYFGEQGTYRLLILSQVVLSLQLPFAVIPLVRLTNDRARMGSFANNITVKLLAWTCSATILLLNMWLAWDQMAAWIAGSGAWRPLVIAGLVAAGGGLGWVMVAIALGPMGAKLPIPGKGVALEVSARPAEIVAEAVYRHILVPLDHSASDVTAIGNALTLARPYHAHVTLLHIEEGVTSQMFGSLASTAEVTEGEDYLEGLAMALRGEGLEVSVLVRHGRSPAHEIAEVAREIHPDLLIMAAHGHRGVKDLIFGTTISSVRHQVRVPILLVRGPSG